MQPLDLTQNKSIFTLNVLQCTSRHVHVSCITAGPSNCFKIVKMIMERNFQPVIIFSFSKKECEAYALQMSKLDFNTGVCILFRKRTF